jgi:hypothetical protein
VPTMPDRARRRRGSSSGHGGPPADGETLLPRILTPQTALAWQRAAGNRAVTGLLRTGGLPVQRWAWVGSKQVMPTDPRLAKEIAGDQTVGERMKSRTTDKQVHAYVSFDEYRAHAAGQTQHLGNVAGPHGKDIWLRFPPGKTSVLGESHDAITLERVVLAVGSKSFVYEVFASDKAPKGSRLKALYDRESAAAFDRLGVGGVPGKTRFGAEPRFPKVTETFLRLKANLDQPHTLVEHSHSAIILKRSLRVAWAHGLDLTEPYVAKTSADRALARKVQDIEDTINPFMRLLTTDAVLGDALETREGIVARRALKEFCDAFVEAMLARIDTDPALTQQQRKALGDRRSTDPVRAAREWRDLHFHRVLKDAVARKVRYVGMGRDHLTALIAMGLPNGAIRFDMAGDALQHFDDKTGERRDSRDIYM